MSRFIKKTSRNNNKNGIIRGNGKNDTGNNTNGNSSDNDICTPNPNSSRNRTSSSPRQSSHRLIGFGSNYYHALGGTSQITLHEQVPACEYLDVGFDVQQLCCTSSSSIILTKSGKIYHVGTLHGLIREKPERVYFNQRVLQVAGGRHFCLARSEQGLVVSWGAGHFGQLGHGPTVSFLEKPQVITHLLPNFTGGEPIISIHCGAWHGAALLNDGKLYTWGSNRRNQCGFNSPSTIVYPQAVEGRYAQIACGKGHNVAIELGTGRVFTWGSSAGCGHSSRRAHVPTPRLLEALQRVVIARVAAGDSHSLALTGGGRLFSWGLGSEGQLGVGGALATVSRPKLVADLDFVAIVAGQQASVPSQADVDGQAENACNLEASRRNSSASLLGNSEVTGPGATSKLGAEEQEYSMSHPLASVPRVVDIYAAGSYSMAMSSSGHLYAWGCNDRGTLGLPHCSDLSEVDPPSTTTGTAQLKSRTLEVRAFDSQHNVLLPKRVDALSDVDIQLVAGGPCHLLVYGKIRDPLQTTPIGKTLCEVQQARRLSSASSLRNSQDESPSLSVDTDLVTSSTELLSLNTDALSPESISTQASSPVKPIVADTPSLKKVQRASNMTKLLQKLTNGSERKKNGDAPTKHALGRVLSAAFGSNTK